MTWKQVMTTLQGFDWNYLSTLLMAAVVSYLGLFTVLRRIVFTGVALAQVAAAGVGTAFFVADSPRLGTTVTRFAGTYGPTLGSFTFTLLAALGLRVRSSRGKVGGDAVVGFLYVTSAALAVLLVWRSSRGHAELREILAGEVLLSSSTELILLAIALITVAAIHVRYRKRFLLVSYDPEFATTLGLRVARIDWLFLATFATAIAFSLRAGGLLLVFAYLVLPGMIGLTLGRRLKDSTIVCVSVALAASLGGYLLAIVEDLPVGHSISALLGLTYVAIQPCRWVPALAAPVRWILVGSALLSIGVAVSLLPSALKKISASAPTSQESPRDPHASHATGNHSRAERIATAVGHLRGGSTRSERLEAAHTLGEIGDANSLPILLLTLSEEDAELRQGAENALDAWGRRRGANAIQEFARGPDTEVAAQASLLLVAKGDPLGLGYLIDLLGREDIPLFVRDTVITELQKGSGQNFGYDAFGELEANRSALVQWKRWWEAQRASESD